MTMCEYDRNILREIRDTLNDIRETLKDMNALNLESVNYMVEKNNQMARIGKEVMLHHLQALERADDGDL